MRVRVRVRVRVGGRDVVLVVNFHKCPCDEAFFANKLDDVSDWY